MWSWYNNPVLNERQKKKGVETMENYFEKVSAMRELSRNSKARKDAAKNLRNERIEELQKINHRVKPTKGIDSGAGGKINELEETREGSEKYRVSKAGQVDNYCSIDGKAQAVEFKENSARIGSILRALASGKDGFIVYHYAVCNKNTKGEMWELPKKIFTYSAFIALLESVGAIRINQGHATKNFVDCEPSIQASTKKFYNAVKNSPALIYDKNKKYTSEEIARVF